MTQHLQHLTLCPFLPNAQRDQLDTLKADLLKSLDRQIHHVEASLNDGVLVDMVRAWLRCEDADEPVPSERFYWQHRTGAWIITLQVDGAVVRISEDRPSIEVGHADDIPNALETVKQAIKANELDDHLRAMMKK